MEARAYFWKKRIRIRSSTTLNVRPSLLCGPRSGRGGHELSSSRGRSLFAKIGMNRCISGQSRTLRGRGGGTPSSCNRSRGARPPRSARPAGSRSRTGPSASGMCPGGPAANRKRRRTPRRSVRGAGGCRPGRSGGRRPSARAPTPAPGRARPRARRSGRSSASGRPPGRGRGRRPGSPAARRCCPSSRRRQNQLVPERIPTQHPVKLRVQRDDVIHLIINRISNRKVDHGRSGGSSRFGPDVIEGRARHSF